MSHSDEIMEKLKELITAGMEHLERNPENREAFRQYVSAMVYPELRDVLKNLLDKIENRHRLEEYEGKKIRVIHYTSISTLVSMLQNARAIVFCDSRPHVSKVRLRISLRRGEDAMLSLK